tara:strand:+ start:381 stop:572 length:192 start_codon:yes stop_codon:yes gene_type:complete
MSGENIVENNDIKQTAAHKKPKVDINILLNRVRLDEKKEKFESLVFVGLLSLVVVGAGIIISL